MAADFFLVIPAFRESRRLPPYLKELVGILSGASFKTEILIVEDGSGQDEQQKLLGALTMGTFGSCQVLQPVLLPDNHGKGYAIIHGWRLSKDTAWVGFLDADGAIPAYEVLRILEMAKQTASVPPPCLWASRIRIMGKNIHRSLRRHLLGRVFATLVSNALDLPVYDTQCGYKLIPRCHYEKIAPLLEEDRFCFDVELLLAVHHVGATVLEIPIDWSDMPGGQLHPIRDGIAMLKRLSVIRRRAKNWSSVV